MPNWCRNRVTISSKTENDSQFKEVLAKFNKPDPFNQFYPQPDWKSIPNQNGDLPKLEQMKNPDGSVAWETYNFPDGKNDDRWYDWSYSNWGTKWDACDKEIEDEEDWAEITFNTAWSPPEGIFHKIKDHFPDVAISWFYDEPGMECAGYL